MASLIKFTSTSFHKFVCKESGIQEDSIDSSAITLCKFAIICAGDFTCFTGIRKFKSSALLKSSALFNRFVAEGIIVIPERVVKAVAHQSLPEGFSLPEAWK